jgi:hypothetical protein
VARLFGFIRPEAECELESPSASHSIARSRFNKKRDKPMHFQEAAPRIIGRLSN